MLQDFKGAILLLLTVNLLIICCLAAAITSEGVAFAAEGTFKSCSTK